MAKEPEKYSEDYWRELGQQNQRFLRKWYATQTPEALRAFYREREQKRQAALKHKRGLDKSNKGTV